MASRKEGTTLGPYRIIEQVGMGGMATVYKAYQASMDRYVALKILPAHYAQDPKFVERFNREARTIAKLEHKNILPVYDFGEENGVAYLAMRYLDGGTLKDVLGLGRLTLSDAVDIMAQVCAALDYAHRQGVIHRDVKPANIMIDSEGAAYLTDFGIAKVLENVTGGLTETGAAVGTPAYMAPEQSLGKPVDARSDIYALGVVLFEMVTGRPPFQADTPMAVALAHIHEPLPLPHEIDAAIPEEIESVILKALSKDPAHRYASAGEMAEALKAALAATSPAVRTGTTLRSLATAAGEQVATRTIKVEGDIFAAPAATRAQAPRKGFALPLWAGIAICAGIVLVAVVGLLFLLGVLPPGGRASTGGGGQTPVVGGQTPVVGEHPVAQAYDSFDDPAWSGAFNPDLWTQPDFSDCDFAQNDGALTLTGPSETEHGCILVVGRPAAVNRDQVEALEARVQVNSDHSGGYIAQGLGIGTQRGGQGRVGWNATCLIAATPDGVSLRFAVGVFNPDGQQAEQYTEQFLAHYDAWYSLRLAVDPATTEVSCWADGDLIGSAVPETAAASADQQLYRGIVAARGQASNGTTRLDDFYLLHPGETSGLGEEEAPPPAAGAYDTFDDPDHNGDYNRSLWAADGDCAFTQTGGVLHVEAAAGADALGCNMVAAEVGAVHGSQLGSFGADVRLLPGEHPGYLSGHIDVFASFENGYWWAGCGVSAIGGDPRAFFTVQTTLDRDTFENLLNNEVEINYDEWESFHLEFDPATMTVRCTLNGESLGEYTPPDADFLREGEFIHELRWYVEPNQTVATDFDNITLELAGAGAGQPPAAGGMVYDTFDDASFDGGYNTALWLLDEDSICAFQQAGGVMTVPGAVAADDTWCVLEMTEHPLAQREGSLRADLLIGGDHNGGYVENLIRLGMHVDGGAWWYADCGLAAEAGDVWATFWIRNVSADDEAVNQAEATSPSTLNEPHEVRLYFDPASGTVACGMDGRVVGQAVPDHFAVALGGDFFAGLVAWRDAGAAATTIVDNFFILP